MNINGRTVPEDAPAQGLLKITTNTPFALCRGLLASADANVDITDAAGAVTTAVPIQKGYNPIAASKCVFTTITLIALY